MPTVSIVLPVYNAEKYLEQTIKSVLEQSYLDYELLLIDDGSVDRSSEICKFFRKKDQRIRYVQQKNHGISFTRNKGLQLAQGDYCAFCDNDDLLDTDFLSDNMRLIQKNNADIVKFGRVTHLNGKLYPTKFGHKKPFVVDGGNIKDEYVSLSNGPSLLYVWDGFFKKSFLRENNISFSESFKNGEEDRNFMFDCLSYAPKIVVNPKCYYHHFIRQSGNTTGSYSPNRIEALKTSLRHEKELLKQLMINNPKYWDNQLLNYFELFLVELMKGYQETGQKACIMKINEFLTEFRLRSVAISNVDKKRYKVILLLLKLHAQFVVYYGSVLKTKQKNRR